MQKTRAPKLKNIIVTSLLSLTAVHLTGCQSFSGLFPDKPETAIPVATPIEHKTIASHEFNLSKDQGIVGAMAAVNTRENDTLSDIARHYGLGYNDITIANPSIEPWTPKADSRVLLPLRFIVPDAPRKGIVLNLANMRMFYYPKKQPNKVFTYPVGIGRQGWSTPMGLTHIADKKANPTWSVPESIQREHAEKGAPLPKFVRSGPDNPLGYYAMRLGFSGYLIHGTNKPYGIGMQVSHGCVQLYPEDIKDLFAKAYVGMDVRITHQPYLTAWDANKMLYLEAHEPLDKWIRNKPQLQKKLLSKLRQISTKSKVNIDWKKVDRILARSDGIPTPILANSPDVVEISKNAMQMAHPGRLFEQPIIGELKDSDWSILVATFDDETKAQEMAAMLNHQGPTIPARKVKKNESYQVIAGPFKNKSEVKAVAKRIRIDFEMSVEPLEPRLISKR
jgi:L,D-transpeptidase ErfK/SrfK